MVLILLSRNDGQIMFWFFFSFHTRSIFDVKILKFRTKFLSKFLLIDSPLMTPATIFSHMRFWILKKNRQMFGKVQKISKFGWLDMPSGSTFKIGTKIILLKIERFLKGWILNINPLKDSMNYIHFYHNMFFLSVISVAFQFFKR